VGDIALLDRGGLAVVGSREADEAASLFTNTLAERCAKEGITVISGDAKGVDREAMTTALDTGGTVVGVLPEGVAKYEARLPATAPGRPVGVGVRPLSRDSLECGQRHASEQVYLCTERLGLRCRIVN